MARPSPVRNAVRERLLRGSRHGWAIDELQQELHRSKVRADYSSVFRAVTWLVQQGIAQRVDLGDGKARYEPASAHHEHVRCVRCGEVAAVRDCVVARASTKIERVTGFQLQSHRLLLAGLCPRCQEA